MHTISMFIISVNRKINFMETPTKYKTEKRSPGFRRQILESSYFQTVKDITCSLALGYERFITDEELCDRTIELADTLIEKVGEKL